MVAWIRTAVMVVIILATSSAVCCKRKGNFGCCGNGPCNIFCCSCDDGCNKECEETRCDTAEWVKCAVILPVCATACANPLQPSCVACLGSLYDTCKKCYSTTALQIFLMPRVSSVEAADNEGRFYALSKSGLMSKEEFIHAVHEAAQTHLEDDENFDIKSFLKKNRFELFDHNGDGFIVVDEACSNSGHGSEL